MTDVVIVGAGLAGLSAARALVKAGADPLVLEARDRVGGRLLNEDIGDGKVLELGGQWVGPTQDRVNALIAELGLSTYHTYDVGRNLLERGGALKRFSGTIPRLPPLALAETGLLLARLNRMAKKVDVERPWTAPADWDRMTFASWMDRHVRTEAAREMLPLAIKTVWACEPEDVSLLHVLFYTRSAGSLELLLDTDGGAQQERVHGGTQRIALRLADELGDRVRLSTPVRRITADAVDGIACKRVIVAMNPTLAARIEYDPPLPAIRDGLMQRMAMGSVVKCMAIYDEPFWRADGLSGQGISADGPISATFDNSPPDGSPGVLLAFLEGRAARRVADLTTDERRTLISEQLGRMFGPRARTPERYIDKAWAADPWTRGCYGGFLPPGGWTDYGAALREPVGTIHWAGAETATVWNGYMDGAIRSGERAAAEVLAYT